MLSELFTLALAPFMQAQLRSHDGSKFLTLDSDQTKGYQLTSLPNGRYVMISLRSESHEVKLRLTWVQLNEFIGQLDDIHRQHQNDLPF